MPDFVHTRESPEMPQQLHILADQNIPFVDDAFGGFGYVQTVAGHEIVPSKLAGVDVLLVRSVTPVNEALLNSSHVRFVGTATAGTEHVDINYLEEQNIGFASAHGSNAESVVEYVLAAMHSVAADEGIGLRNRVIGIVGCGAVGGQLARRAEAIGIEVLRCDPFLAKENPSDFVSLNDLLGRVDFVSMHTPLTRVGEHPTFHMVDSTALERMKPDAWLINSARGAVVDNLALKKAIQGRQIAGAILDVWENEPIPDLELAVLARIATPHIAGYSLDGKVSGTKMLEGALRNWCADSGISVPTSWDLQTSLNHAGYTLSQLWAPPVSGDIPEVEETRWLNVLIRQAYNLGGDDTRFRQAITGSTDPATAFRQLRKTYPVRRAWSKLSVSANVPDALGVAVESGLRMNRQASG